MSLETNTAGGLSHLKHHRPAAFSLVEVVLALAITSFALLTLLALCAIGLKSNQASINESDAVNALTAVVSDLQVSATNGLTNPAAASAIYAISPLPLAAGAATPVGVYYLTAQDTVTSSAAAARYRLEVAYVPAASGTSTAGVNLRISWPAPASAANAQGRVETYFNFVHP